RWRMRAEIAVKNNNRAFFELDSKQEKLRVAGSSDEIEEPILVEKLLLKWPELPSEWMLQRSCEIIDLGEAAFVPDLVARNMNGHEIHIELIGFWTPRYLEDRLKEFAHDRMENYLLVVSEELRGSRESPLNLPPNVLTYKMSLDARTLLAALERL